MKKQNRNTPSVFARMSLLYLLHFWWHKKNWPLPSCLLFLSLVLIHDAVTLATHMTLSATVTAPTATQTSYAYISGHKHYLLCTLNNTSPTCSIFPHKHILIQQLSHSCTPVFHLVLQTCPFQTNELFLSTPKMNEIKAFEGFYGQNKGSWTGWQHYTLYIVLPSYSLEIAPSSPLLPSSSKAV